MSSRPGGADRHWQSAPVGLQGQGAMCGLTMLAHNGQCVNKGLCRLRLGAMTLGTLASAKYLICLILAENGI